MLPSHQRPRPTVWLAEIIETIEPVDSQHLQKTLSLSHGWKATKTGAMRTHYISLWIKDFKYSEIILCSLGFLPTRKPGRNLKVIDSLHTFQILNS